MLQRLFAAAAVALAATLAVPALAANPQVQFDTTAGSFKVELYPDAAPKSVANFLDYVKAKHYDGTQFHRVIPGFMIQGGGFTADFMQKPTKPPVVNEAEQASKAGLLNVPGTLAMARTSDPNSATVAILHQRRRQQVPELPLAGSCRHRLHGVRQGRERDGRRRQDRQGAHRRGRAVSQGRSGGEGHHHQGLRRRDEVRR